MLKIRRPLGRLIFNMGIAIPGKTVFLIETAPRSALVQLMACHLFSAKPLSEPVLGYYQLDLWEQTSAKFLSKYKIFHSRKCIWKYRLGKHDHFVQGEIDWLVNQSTVLHMPWQHYCHGMCKIGTWFDHYSFYIRFICILQDLGNGLLNIYGMDPSKHIRLRVYHSFSTLRLVQNGCHFADDIFKCSIF